MEDNKLEIYIFGGLELRYKDKVIGANVSKGRSRKMWTMLEYILLNSDRKVPQEELIEILWPDMRASNPANSLKVLVFKLRNEIDALGFMPGKDVIPCISGAYCFNDNVPYSIDIDDFERCIETANNPATPDDDKLDNLLKAIKIFRGNALTESQKEPWAASVQTHYMTMYKNAVEKAQKLLTERERYQEIVDICKQALLIQPYTEDYYYYAIRAYAALEDYSAASEMYEHVKKVMQKEYEVAPDENFEDAYKVLMKNKPKKNLSVDEFTEIFEEHNNYLESFIVEFGEFKQIYRLVARGLERAGHTAYLCIYTLGVEKGSKISPKQKQANIKVLEDALLFMGSNNNVGRFIGECVLSGGEGEER